MSRRKLNSMILATTTLTFSFTDHDLPVPQLPDSSEYHLGKNVATTVIDQGVLHSEYSTLHRLPRNHPQDSHHISLEASGRKHFAYPFRAIDTIPFSTHLTSIALFSFLRSIRGSLTPGRLRLRAISFSLEFFSLRVRFKF